MFQKMDQAAKELLQSIVQLAFHMNGGIQYDDLMWRTPLERDLMQEFLVERMESMNKKIKNVKT